MNKICDECETVAHCTKHGCIPKVSVKEAMKLALEALEGSTDKTLSIRAMIALQKALAEQPAQQQQQEQKYLEDLHNALQRIDTAAVGLPTFEVRHEGGLDAVTQNIVDAITALHTQPAQRKPLTEEEIGAMWVTARRNSPVPHVVFARAIEAAHGIKENT